MRNTILFIFLSFVLIGSAKAQNSVQSKRFTFEKKAQVNPKNLTKTYSPKLQNLEAPKPGGDGYWGFVMEQKEKVRERWPIKRGVAMKTATADSSIMPILGQEFTANPAFEGVPNDNCMAISNEGKMVSAINSNLFMYDVIADSMTHSITLEDFCDTLNLPTSKYDPKLLFDPKQEKFILVFLNGFTDSTNYIVVAFSETNDPNGNWNLYALPGNPFNDTTWSDYPMIAMTDQELFITVNFLCTGCSWQAGFMQSVIWQINKEDGYNGDSLTTELWSNINYGGKPLRNLTPMRGGSTTYGPNMYFVSNRNFDLTNDSIWILELTDTIDASAATVNIDVRLSDQAYGMPPNGNQKFNTYFATNDARALNGFLENDMLQFVGNTVDTSTGLAGIYHGFVRNVSTTKDVTGKILGDASLDFGYPNISYTGTSNTDEEAIISFNQASPQSNDGMSAIFYDNLGNHSARLTIKTGDNFVNVLQGAIERWGDYSGSQPKYDEPGVVWTTASYGKQNRTFGTYVAELSSPSLFANRPKPEPGPGAKVYPNPSRNFFKLDFELAQTAVIKIKLYNIQGQLMKTFFNDRAKAGSNRFTFSTDPLSNGIYLLKVTDGENLNISRRIVKSE